MKYMCWSEADYNAASTQLVSDIIDVINEEAEAARG